MTKTARIAALALAALALAGCSSEEKSTNNAAIRDSIFGTKTPKALTVGSTTANVTSTTCTGTEEQAGFKVVGTLGPDPFELSHPAGGSVTMKRGDTNFVLSGGSFGASLKFVDLDIMMSPQGSDAKFPVVGVFACD